MGPSVDLERRMLRGEVRMAGDATRRLRDSLLRTVARSAGWTMATPVALFILAPLLSVARSFGAVSTAVEAVAIVCLVLLFPLMVISLGAASVLLGCLAGLPFVPRFDRFQRRRLLRRRLAAVPREEAYQAILPLTRDACPETRRMVRDLLQELRPRAREVQPAEPPAGRGSELAA